MFCVPVMKTCQNAERRTDEASVPLDRSTRGVIDTLHAGPEHWGGKWVHLSTCSANVPSHFLRRLLLGRRVFLCNPPPPPPPPLLFTPGLLVTIIVGECLPCLSQSTRTILPISSQISLSTFDPRGNETSL